MEPGNKKGLETMAQSTFEQTSEHIADTVHKASRAASAAAEAIEDGVGAAARAVKHGGYAAVEAYDDAKRRVQRKPIESVLATLAVGIAAGTAISWIMRRKRSCNCGDM
jgi:hypothetical protein